MNLDSLILTEEELNRAREHVQKLAYCKWQEAGCPDSDPLEFWTLAEREWINHVYVPNRSPSPVTPAT